MKYLSYLILTSFLIVMQGCAMSNVAKDYSFTPSSPNGLFVGSITYEGYYAEYSIYIKNLDTGEIDRISGGGTMTPFHLFDPKGNLDHLGIKGDLFVVELKPGNYEVFRWSVDPGNGTFLSSQNSFSIKFKINPGRALYFGSVNFKQTATFGVTISGADAYYVNRYDRDVKEFKTTYNNVTLPKIDSSLKKGQALALGGDIKPTEAILFDSISTSLSMPTPGN